MNWVSIQTKTLNSPEVVCSTMSAVGTWFSVLVYSVGQENGGRLAGAAAWKDREWQRMCGVTAREVRSAKKLLIFDGEDLLVAFYPVEKEAEVRAKREAGRRGGVLSGEARLRQSRSTASSRADIFP